MRKIESLPNTEPASEDFPFGRIKDETTEQLGTPIVEATYSDIAQSMYRFMQAATEVPNDLPDSKTNGWQLVRAIERVLYPIGTIRMKANSVDADCLECNGEVYSPATYPDLFQAIGNIYGGTLEAPRLPSMMYCFPMGRSIFNALGTVGGQSVVTLAPNQIPYHTHSAQDGKGWLAGYLMTLCEYYEGSAENNDGYAIKRAGGGAILSSTTTGAFGNAGFGTDSHNNIPPYTTVIFQIKAKYIGNG